MVIICSEQKVQSYVLKTELFLKTHLLVLKHSHKLQNTVIDIVTWSVA